jgi:hypothetical protein
MDSGVLDTLLGGFLAIAGGAAVFWLERRAAREDSRREKLELQGAKLLSMIVNIQQMHAWNTTIGRSIDECFESVDDPNGEIEPGLKVLPIIIPDVAPRAFSSDELGFAFSTADTGLLEKLLSLATNFSANLQTLREFNEIRKGHMAFVQANATHGDFFDGEAASVEIPHAKKHQHESNVVMLNQLVALLLDSTTRDAKNCIETLERLRTAANSIKGLKVPIVSFVEMRTKHANS